MFSRSRKNQNVGVHYVHVPRKSQNYLPMIIFTMLITLIICISIDHVPAGSKKDLKGSRIVKMIDTGINKLQKRVFLAKKKVNKYIGKKNIHRKSNHK